MNKDKSNITNRLTDEQVRDMNEARKENGLPPLAIKKRKCLNCSKLFRSEGAYHRICGRCKSRHNISGTIPESGVLK